MEALLLCHRGKINDKFGLSKASFGGILASSFFFFLKKSEGLFVGEGAYIRRNTVFVQFDTVNGLIFANMPICILGQKFKNLANI